MSLSVSSNSTAIDPVDIRGYATFQSVSWFSASAIDFERKGDYFNISTDGKWLEWWRYDGKSKKEMIEKFDLQGLVKKWVDLRKSNSSYIELPKEDKTADFRGKNGALRLFIESGNAAYKDGSWALENLTGFLFIK